jgi:hypothetical protein
VTHAPPFAIVAGAVLLARRAVRSTQVGVDLVIFVVVFTVGLLGTDAIIHLVTAALAVCGAFQVLDLAQAQGRAHE